MTNALFLCAAAGVSIAHVGVNLGGLWLALVPVGACCFIAACAAQSRVTGGNQ